MTGMASTRRVGLLYPWIPAEVLAVPKPSELCHKETFLRTQATEAAVPGPPRWGAAQYATRKGQAMSTSSRQRQWQLQWHEILNDYPDPDGGDSVTPEPLPELDTDFRLQFNLWQLPREARQRAFAILPCGAEMLARIDEYLSARPEPLEPQQATTLLRTGLKRAREAGVQDVPSWEMHIDIVEMDTPLAQVFQHAGDPLDEVRDDLSKRSRTHHGELGWDAYFFLREPLYRLRSDCAVAKPIKCADVPPIDTKMASVKVELVINLKTANDCCKGRSADFSPLSMRPV